MAIVFVSVKFLTLTYQFAAIQAAENHTKLLRPGGFMTTIIWKKHQPNGTCKSRYKMRRAQALAMLEQEKQLARRVARGLSGCSPKVLKALH